MLSAYLHETESTAGRLCFFFLVPSICVVIFHHQPISLRIWFAWELPLSSLAFEDDLIDRLVREGRNGHSQTPTHLRMFWMLFYGCDFFQLISLRCHLAEPKETPSPWTKKIDLNEESKSWLFALGIFAAARVSYRYHVCSRIFDISWYFNEQQEAKTNARSKVLMQSWLSPRLWRSACS